mmetsp:Transcript_4743/g.21223  ORF Transcript_4743/g.21223 Transcript_4743/m.21223 type:complete len:286 (+) Transcript_4743:205-1062(+)
MTEVMVRVVVVSRLDPGDEIPQREGRAKSLRGGGVRVNAVVRRGLAIHAEQSERPEHQEHVLADLLGGHRQRIEVPGVDQVAVDVREVNREFLRGGERRGGVERARARALPLLSHLQLGSRANRRELVFVVRVVRGVGVVGETLRSRRRLERDVVDGDAARRARRLVHRRRGSGLGVAREVLARGIRHAHHGLEAEAPLHRRARRRGSRAFALLANRGWRGYLDAEALTLLRVRRSARGGGLGVDRPPGSLHVGEPGAGVVVDVLVVQVLVEHVAALRARSGDVG